MNRTMLNSSSVSNRRYTLTVQMTITILMLFCLFFFIYFITVLLSIYFTTPRVRENSRYILFAHMLVNDTLYLIIGLFLLLVALYSISLPVPICYILVTVSSTSFKITPYNLAVMALERYIAICFPLRHGELCTRQSALIAISVIWVIGLIPNFADFVTLSSSIEMNFLSRSVYCSRATFTITAVQNNIRFFTHTFTFSLVGLIIIFTYVKIMLVAFKIGSGKATASKAGKTVMLHAGQLLLCMFAFSYTLTELYFRAYLIILPIINFFFFMCLPRILSPLIYGLRDEVFRIYIKRFILCSTRTESH